MHLIVFRHGIAHDRDAPDCPSDPERRLTEKGVRRTRQAALGLGALQVRPHRIYTSPYLRAHETAEIATEALGVARSVVSSQDALLPDRDPAEILEILRGHTDEEVMVVGHAPHLDDLISRCLGQDRIVARLKKAGAALLAFDSPDSPAELRWLLPAWVLREIGEG